MFKDNQVKHAVVTGIPNSKTLSLYQQSPSSIIPFLNVYQHPSDKQTWHQNKKLLKPLKQQLQQHLWAGIGELHIFAEHRHSEVFKTILNLADQNNLKLMMHCDPAVIDEIYQQHSDLKVIWAHAGAYPYPPLLHDYLQRYPDLYLDVSMRNKQIAPNGKLEPEWENLLLAFSDRIMLGIDTYSELRWDDYSHSIAEAQQWIQQLPTSVQQDINFRTAKELFNLQAKKE
jgi:predicted TIM-barrel fold metal-dependent hydrolase